MAGVLAQERCKGCSSAHCACGDRGTWSEPSLLSQRLSEDSMRQQLLQTWTSACHSPRGAADEHRPLVFLCAGCRRPLGDSLSWVTSPDGSCILLRSVSSAVAVGKEPVLSRRENENGCVLETLHCAGCALSLGYIYRCTPDHLDYKRDLFCLKVEATESLECLEEIGILKLVHKEVPLVFWKSRGTKPSHFCLCESSKEVIFRSFERCRGCLHPLGFLENVRKQGSSEKQIVSEDKELFNLESRVEIENSLKQMEDVLKVLQTKLQDVETKLSSSSSHAETSCESPV